MKKINFAVLLLALLAFLQVNGQQDKPDRSQQKYRPLYHFSPEKGWIGDPDGLVINDGVFHLYWWGHATSTDLIHWQEHPKPMKGDDGSFSYFSGSVAVDNNNTSGFGKKSMIAVYTKHFAGDTLPETQAISISTDTGRTFHYYKQNPVLDINQIFFRDPQVFWHERDNLWKMVVSRPDVQQIQIYESPDLKQWSYCSSFQEKGATGEFWECPDLFQLPVAGSTEKKWVMIVGVGPSKVKYFVGDFDGKEFRSSDHLNDQGSRQPRLLDYGLDYYATRTWRNYDKNRDTRDSVFSIAWMGNWSYANKVPTQWGKGFESLPRLLSLKKTSAGYQLIQLPVPQLKQLRGPAHSARVLVKGNQALNVFKPAMNTYEIEATIQPSAQATSGLELLVGEGRKLVISYDPVSSMISLDRTNCSDYTRDSVFTRLFAKKVSAALPMKNGAIRLHVFVDRSSVEVFANDGEMAMSVATFASDKQLGIRLFSNRGTTRFNLKAWELKSIYNNK